jgi:predicted kinase
MNKAYMLIGPPAAGKSTFTKTLRDVVVINPDSIREQLTGDAAGQSRNGEVWKRTYADVAYHLTLGDNVVIDATFANAPQRQEMVEWCKRFTNEVHGVVFRVPIEELKRRNQGRDRKVPDHVIDRMFQSLQQSPPNHSEGFTHLTYI